MENFFNFFTLDRSIEILGLLIGVLYLYWEYYADPKMWFANIAMPILSFWVYYRAGLYADFAMNFYYFFIAIYGYWAWTHHRSGKNNKSKSTKLQITYLPLKYYALVFLIWAVIYCLIAFMLIECTDSTVPYWDAFTTSLSIVAMWMLARKYIEQWVAWFLVDMVTAGLCVYKDRPFYAVLYSIYTIVAVFGYFKWRRMMSQKEN